MTEKEKQSLNDRRMALLIGTMIGQISELLNSIKQTTMTKDMIYRSLYDIHCAAGLQAHELFYKGNKPS